jgi:hypothetical protein
MAHTTTLAARVLTVAVLGSLGLRAAPAPAAAMTGPEAAPLAAADPLDAPGVYGADPAAEARIEWAMTRFADAGLALPVLRVYVHPTMDGCQGNAGLYSHDGTHGRVDLCTPSTWALLHELAHAWEHHSMTDTTRHAFLERTGLGTWADPGAAWVERGTEAAAQTVAWGLLDIPLTNPDRFTEELHLFELLTGTPTPRLP